MTARTHEAESDGDGMTTNNIQDVVEKLLAVHRDMKNVMSRTNLILERMLPAFETVDGDVRDLEEGRQQSEESRAHASSNEEVRGRGGSEKVIIFCNWLTAEPGLCLLILFGSGISNWLSIECRTKIVQIRRCDD
jgi:hypothetical protein